MILIKRDTDNNEDNDNIQLILGETLIGIIIFALILLCILYKSFLACCFKHSKTLRNNSSAINIPNRSRLFGFKYNSNNRVLNSLEIRSANTPYLYNSNNQLGSNIVNEDRWKSEDLLPRYNSKADNSERLEMPPQALLSGKDDLPPLYHNLPT
jgi:hypothetical protein